ncbi:hypothetical protein I79_002462 [Cricetulus griseus]|uniref:Uncharacterized protein n=1 Tax=Cricetulus griseus TaxID=10029 RepID=G3GXH2_CRIGR|nr:hypothetical protein I79_002462 [Cricetulus griseus]
MIDAHNSAKEVESTKGASQGSGWSTLGKEGRDAGVGLQCGDAGLLGLAYTA